MTHELRTPLNSILGSTQLSQFDDTNLNQIQINNISNTETAGNELLSKIEIIMLYSKFKSKTLKLQYSETDLGLILESIINKINPAITPYKVFPKIISTEEADITADIPLFQKALSNVLNNAIHPKGPHSYLL